ncbi:MAG: elongation factor G [Bacillota bacterium]
MKIFDTENIRNLAIVAHGGAGKTSLAEAMLFNSGAIKRLGRVDEGNTTTDYFPEEIKRKVTINATLAPVEWKEKKINLIDTPGYADFFGDVKGALRVVDALLVVIRPVSGVEVQTEIVWEHADRSGIPRIAFINKMDRENANFNKVVDDMRAKLTKKIIPIQFPLGAAETFTGIIDLIEMKAYKFDASGQPKETDIPDEISDEALTYREGMIEAAAEADDELLMKYLDGEQLNEEEIRMGLRKGVVSGELVPVLCGSATKNIAIIPLMNFLAEFAPSPLDRVSENNINKSQLAALVFKTIADPYVGKLSFFRVYGGVLKADTTVYNSNKETEEKVGQLFIPLGKVQQPVTEVRLGDIAAVAKLQTTTTGETLATKSNPVILEGIEFPEPTLSVAISPKSKGDEDKLGHAINRLLEEDPTLRYGKNAETREALLTGMGELHLDIILERLHRKFGVEVTMASPKLPYRETVRNTVTKIEGKHKKQTGGHGQFGHVYIDMAPLPGEDFVFDEKIFGGSVPRQYIPAVEKGIRESMQEGVIAGYPVTNIRVTLVDGSYHPVDSSEMAFKVAAHLAFRKAMDIAKPVLLEPIVSVEVLVPDHYMGDIIGDLNSKRGRILGMEPQGKNQLIRAHVPMAEMYRYAIDLKSITQGRGQFRMEFSQYEEVPSMIADKMIATAKAAKAAEKE